VILACIVLTVTNVAAFWAWRLAEVSLEKIKIEKMGEFLRANKAAKEYANIKNELDVLKINRVNDHNVHDNQLAKLKDEKLTMSKNLIKLGDRIEGLQNEIDGLNVDKLHLKSELAKYRAIHEKRKAQKAANMRRFRAKQKEAKG
jgi:septal ring factor EnvC (AmiA/AmiB activator)